MYGIGIWGLSPHSLDKILPSINKVKKFNFIGFLSREANNSLSHKAPYKIFTNEKDFLNNQDLDIVVIATPPALHYKHAKASLLKGKNIIVEKPISIRMQDTKDLTKIAKKLNLLIIEAYYYKIHEQYKVIKSFFINHKNKPLTIVSRFGIPKLNRESFRDKKVLGGSVFWDVGCYPISIVSDFFELESLKINFTKIHTPNNFDIDLNGMSVLTSIYNQNIFLEWNMGYSYQNSIEIWTEEVYIKSEYIFSKPQNIKISIQNYDKYGNKSIKYINNENCIDLFYENISKNILSNNFKKRSLSELEKLAKLQHNILTFNK